MSSDFKWNINQCRLIGSPLEGLQSLGKRWENIFALQCFLSSLPFPLRMCFPFLLENLLSDLCAAASPGPAVSAALCCRSRSAFCTHSCTQAQLETPGQALLALASLSSLWKLVNLAPWVLWWIPLAYAKGFILSVLQTHPWNLSLRLPSTLWLRLSLEKHQS